MSQSQQQQRPLVSEKELKELIKQQTLNCHNQ